MSNDPNKPELTRAEVDQLLRLIDRADFDVIEIEWKGIRLHLSRGQAALQPAPTPSPAAPGTRVDDVQGIEPQPLPGGAVPEKASRSEEPPSEDTAVPEGHEPVAAPTMGTFYRASEPGAAAFVDVGSRVADGDTLALIEVMKVFSAVVSDCAGTVREIRARDGALVEYGQILFVIEPDA